MVCFSYFVQAGDTSIGWALGYMLSLSSLLPGESMGLRKALHPEAWAGLIFLFVFLILIVSGYLLLKTCQKKDNDSII